MRSRSPAPRSRRESTRCRWRSSRARHATIKLLLDHREDLVSERTRIQNRLRWLLHDRWPELELPTGCLDRLCWLDRLAGKLSRASQDADVRVMRAQVRRLKELVREAAALE